MRALLLSSFLLPVPALAGPEIVTDLPLTASLVGMVAGEHAQVTSLLPAGGDPHHFQLRPSQARALSRADLLVWIGPELTPWIKSPASAELRLLDLPGTHLRGPEAHADHGGDHDHDHDHGGHDHDHDHGADHAALEDDHDAHAPAHHPEDEAESHEHHAHDHHGIDPHAWLDPENAALWTEAIAARLSALDPENADHYTANADAAARKITEMDARLRATLAPFRGQSFVTFHDAYGYFTAHYGLAPTISISLGDASAPSAARLREARARIAETGASCAYPEVNHDATAIARATEGTGLRIGPALAPSGGDLAPSGTLYLTLMENLGNRLAACLGE